MPEIQWQTTKRTAPPWLRVWMYGETGSGKTEAASTFPDPVFLIPANENSHETLRNKELPMIIVGSGKNPLTGGKSNGPMEDMISVLENLHAIQRKDPAGLPGSTLVIDAMTHYSDLVLADITRGNPVEIRDWGVLLSHMLRIRDLAFGLDMHVVFCSLGTSDKDDKGNVLYAGPMLQGAAKEKLPSSCSILAYCDCLTTPNGNVFSVNFQKKGSWPARARGFGFPASIQNFKFDKLMPYLVSNPQPAQGA